MSLEDSLKLIYFLIRVKNLTKLGRAWGLWILLSMKSDISLNQLVSNHEFLLETKYTESLDVIKNKWMLYIANNFACYYQSFKISFWFNDY